MRLEELEARNQPAFIMSIGTHVTYETLNSIGVNADHLIQPFEDDFQANANTAMVDGKLIAIAPAKDGGPRVQVYELDDNQNAAKIADFFAFEPEFRGGVNVDFRYNPDSRLYDLVVAASNGGGPRYQYYTNSGTGFDKTLDTFVGDRDLRDGLQINAYLDTVFAGEGSIGLLRNMVTGQSFETTPFTTFAYGSVLGQEPKLYTLSTDVLNTIDSTGNITHTTNVFAPFTNLSFGGYVQSNAYLLIASHEDGSFVELDDVFGIPLSYDTYKRSYYNDTHTLVGNAQPPVRLGDPLPDLEDLKTLSYQEAIYNGLSIGTSAGTGTYTATVDFHGTPVGLTNRHVVEPRTFDGPLGSPIYSPGPADTHNAPNEIGRTLAKSDIESDDVDSALFSLTEVTPQESKFKIIYFDPYKNEEGTITLPLSYDPNVTLQVGDLAYKTGRTTGLTRGIVAYDDLSVDVMYPDSVVRTLENQIVVFGNLFAQPGDSGSATIKVVGDKYYLTAQLFAGSIAYGIVTPINRVFSTLGVTLWHAP